MARSTYGVYLMDMTTTPGDKLVDIKDYPDLQGEPNLLDTTTLSDSGVTQILGIQQAAAKTFTANYDLDIYETLKAKEGVDMPIAVWFGHDAQGAPDGSDGKFEGKGMMSVVVTGGGVNAVQEMTITFAMSENFELVE